MKKIVAAVCGICCLLLSGCGGIHSENTEVGRLLIIQAMGFDSDADGLVLSVSSGSDGMGGQSEASQENLRMRAAAKTLLEAQELIRDHSASQELFFAHTSYILIGENALIGGVAEYLDYIERNDAFRLDVPVFAVTNGSAEEIIVGTGSEQYDSVNVLSSVERNVAERGDAYVYSAGEIAADINANGSALICAVRAVPAGEIMTDAEDGETTAVFDGYAIIKNGKLSGTVSAEDAIAVNLLLGKSGPSPIDLTAGDCSATLRLTDSDCDISLVCGVDDAPQGIEVKLKLSADLREVRGDIELAELNAAFKKDMLGKVSSVLFASRDLGCDFLQLGALLQKDDPFGLRCTAARFQSLLPDLYININIQTQIDGGSVLERPR